jgi:Transposase.
MGKAKDLSTEKKSAIIALLTNSKLSQRQIGTACEVSQAPVRRINQKLKLNQPTDVARKGRCGRKSVVTPRGKRILQKIAIGNRRATHATIKQKLEDAGCSVSVATVRRNLYDLGFKCRRPVKKPRLTPAMVQKRWTWANAHKHLTVDDWRIVS